MAHQTFRSSRENTLNSSKIEIAIYFELKSVAEKVDAYNGDVETLTVRFDRSNVLMMKRTQTKGATPFILQAHLYLK